MKSSGVKCILSINKFHKNRRLFSSSSSKYSSVHDFIFQQQSQLLNEISSFYEEYDEKVLLWQEMTNHFSLQQQNSNSHNICLKTFYGRHNSPFLFNDFCSFNPFKFLFPILFITDFCFFKIFHCLDILRMSQHITFN